MMTFNERLFYLRNEKGLSHSKLASEMDKSEGAVRSWEAGRSKPDLDTLIKLAEYFGCTTDYLLGLSEFNDDADKKQTSQAVDDHVKRMRALSKTSRLTALETIEGILNNFEALESMDDDGLSELFCINIIGVIQTINLCFTLARRYTQLVKGDGNQDDYSEDILDHMKDMYRQLVEWFHNYSNHPLDEMSKIMNIDDQLSIDELLKKSTELNDLLKR